MRATVIKFGIFITVCAIFTVYLAFTIGNIRPSHLWFFHKDYSLKAYFDDVSGLNNGDNVKVAGVVVGKVKSIHVVDGPLGHGGDGNGRALVTFQVHKSVRVPANSVASIRWRNLIGQRYIYLNPPPADQALPVVLRPGDTVAKTIAVVDIGELFNRLGPIIRALDPAKVNDFLDAFTGALSGNEDNLRSALDNLATLTASLASHDNAIGRLIGNVNTVAATVNNRDQEIRTILDNLVALSTTFSDNTQVVDDAVTQLGTVNTNLDRLLANNRGQIDNILNNLRILLGVVQAKIPVLNTTLAGLPTAARAIFSVGDLGQWLNQIIPCGAVNTGLPGILGDAQLPCTVANFVNGSAGATATAGSSATARPAAPGSTPASPASPAPLAPTRIIGIGNVLTGLAGL
jgi:phospholipid/cholesterol/gamma-HCH transport system substrate-binding protein